METGGNHIPDGVVTEILSRFPAKSLIKCRRLSKQWNEILTTNLQFSLLHFKSHVQRRNPPPPPGVIAVRNISKYTQLYFATDYDSFETATRLKFPFHPSSSKRKPPPKYQLIGVSHGLICLTNDSVAYLWNPLINHHITFQCPPIPLAFADDNTVYAFGFDPNSNDCKIIRILSAYKRSRLESQYVVHTIGKPGWRTITAKSYHIPSKHNEYPPTVNGVVYWIGADLKSENEELIISFDLGSETFDSTRLPSSIHDTDSGLVTVGELHGSLCVFNLPRNRGVDIWVRDSNGFWTKTYVINKKMVEGTVYSMLPLNGGSIERVLIKQCLRAFYVFSSKTRAVRKLQSFKFETSGAYNFVETLISPKELERSKRKRTRSSKMDQIQHKYVEIRGLKLHIAEIGTGDKVVVFLHGFPEIWYSWRHQMIAVANAGYRAIAPDFRGYGLSQVLSEPEKTTFKDLIDDLHAILNSFAIPKVFVIAKDFGARVASHFALLHPERVAGVVTLGVPCTSPEHSFARQGGVPEGLYVLRRQTPGRAEADFGRFDVKTVLRNIYILFSKSEAPVADENQNIMDLVDPSTPLPSWFTEEDLSVYAGLYEKSGFHTPLQVCYRALQENLGVTNARVMGPVLLIMGEKNYSLKLRGLENYITSGKVKEYVPDLEVIWLPEGSHFVQEQFPEKVNQLITGFLSKHS